MDGVKTLNKPWNGLKVVPKQSDRVSIALALNAAKLAGEIAAMEVWVADGMKDVGTCGGSMLEFDGRTLVAKVAEEIGLVRRSGNEYWLLLPMPVGIWSQNEQIPQAQYRAFRKSLAEAGFGKSIKKWWDYVD